MRSAAQNRVMTPFYAQTSSYHTSYILLDGRITQIVFVTAIDLGGIEGGAYVS